MTDAERTRQDTALEEAGQLFLRFGYRKTSMDDIARAAGVSRQALYLWFPNKEALFCAVVDRLLSTLGEGVRAALHPEGPLGERLLLAFTAYTGMFVEMSASASRLEELLEASERLLGERVASFERAFERQIADALEDAGRADPVERAYALVQASYGLKHKAASVAAYQEGMRRVIAVVCGEAGGR